MKTSINLAAAVVMMTAVGAWLAPGSAFAQSLNGCDSANTTTTTETFLGNSNNPAEPGQGGNGTSTVTTEQPAPKKCPATETTTDSPGSSGGG